jgi:hypothetical protein
MKKLLILAVIAGSFVSLEAKAQERAGSAAIGAVSGAVVLGPIGAVAGALIGFTAGPAIARSWSVGHSPPPSRVRQIGQATGGTQEAFRATPLPQPKPAEAVASKFAPRESGASELASAGYAPPVQGLE